MTKREKRKRISEKINEDLVLVRSGLEISRELPYIYTLFCLGFIGLLDRFDLSVYT